MFLNDMLTNTNVVRWSRRGEEIKKSQINPDISPRKRFSLVRTDDKGNPQ
jgi:hypothetical protein